MSLALARHVHHVAEGLVAQHQPRGLGGDFGVAAGGETDHAHRDRLMTVAFAVEIHPHGRHARVVPTADAGSRIGTAGDKDAQHRIVVAAVVVADQLPAGVTEGVDVRLGHVQAGGASRQTLQMQVEGDGNLAVDDADGFEEAVTAHDGAVEDAGLVGVRIDENEMVDGQVRFLARWETVVREQLGNLAASQLNCRHSSSFHQETTRTMPLRGQEKKTGSGSQRHCLLPYSVSAVTPEQPKQFSVP